MRCILEFSWLFQWQMSERLVFISIDRCWSSTNRSHDDDSVHSQLESIDSDQSIIYLVIHLHFHWHSSMERNVRTREKHENNSIHHWLIDVDFNIQLNFIWQWNWSFEKQIKFYFQNSEMINQWFSCQKSFILIPFYEINEIWRKAKPLSKRKRHFFPCRRLR